MRLLLTSIAAVSIAILVLGFGLAVATVSMRPSNAHVTADIKTRQITITTVRPSGDAGVSRTSSAAGRNSTSSAVRETRSTAFSSCFAPRHAAIDSLNQFIVVLLSRLLLVEIGVDSSVGFSQFVM